MNVCSVARGVGVFVILLVVTFINATSGSEYEKVERELIKLTQGIQRTVEVIKGTYEPDQASEATRVLNEELARLKTSKNFEAMSASNKKVVGKAFLLASKLDFDMVNGFANIVTSYEFKKPPVVSGRVSKVLCEQRGEYFLKQENLLKTKLINGEEIIPMLKKQFLTLGPNILIMRVQSK
ncbi:MAG: hypothetical protein JW725_03840 [Candidatus Babeliaceae bacterium]|nr:hypothetical protein [Candidatus Babeliaceae bacterium]